ncbi:MAG: LPS export ABC transporter periplasmic protein LptC [Bacteroidales bacterium]|jgi:LPS export ABC transporter protein LptC|nr:LPS export ABC transporter periplasmic protein LptC [Bacteroidales bacterium]
MLKAPIKLWLSTGLILFSLLIVSCSKSKEAEAFLRHKENDPEMSAQNIDVLFSDSGKVQARLTSPLLNQYGGESPYMELPRGFKIYIYDSVRRVGTSITGNRGIRRDMNRTMEAWGNVVVRSEKKNQQLNTEHLVWDENKHRIWSDVKVKITTPDKILFGDKMESNEDFTNYIIQNVTGQMTVKKDSL